MSVTMSLTAGRKRYRQNDIETQSKKKMCLKSVKGETESGSDISEAGEMSDIGEGGEGGEGGEMSDGYIDEDSDDSETRYGG